MTTKAGAAQPVAHRRGAVPRPAGNQKGDAVGQGTSRDYVAQLFETEALLNRVLAQEQCFSLRQLAVNGTDLQALGLRGRPVGEMLHALLDA